MNTFVAIWILVASASQLQVGAGKEVNVTVFYESLCPDSQAFVRRQLYPTYKELGEHMSVELVPFGKARYRTRPWSISCQHGRDECLGNAVQACALARYQDPEMQINFVNCVMSEYRPHTAGRRCAKRLEYPYDGVEECATGEEGRELSALHGDRTRAFRERLSFVPTILFNDVYSERDQKDALRNLKSVVCRKMETAPSQCTRK